MSVSLIGAAAGAGLSFIGTRAANKAQNELINKQMNAVADNYNHTQDLIKSEYQKYKEQLETQQFFQGIETNKAKSSSRLASAASGFSGVSTKTVINNIKLQDRYRKNIQHRNLVTTLESSENKALTNYLQSQQMIDEMDASRPTLGESVTNVISGGIQGFSTGMNIASGLENLAASRS